MLKICHTNNQTVNKALCHIFFYCKGEIFKKNMNHVSGEEGREITTKHPRNTLARRIS